jgi:hypothetical protein
MRTQAGAEVAADRPGLLVSLPDPSIPLIMDCGSYYCARNEEGLVVFR